ncbi:hypothetical protein ACWOAH_09755 [Vagococcus vulneris]|uniref:Uncharacterized protein n=1 Tax=Vagococcus vulneris TaxID=1977869 RepID=A0A429ZTS4_9ENTE|nr:hypothetical protein [Vagococcus vulneris]RST97134.1 hypothetical protein CBF37_10155 [Vagococcus vulneris]
MKEKEQEYTQLIIESGDLSGALQGLGSFIFDKFTSTKIERTDLSALQGLVKAIEIMATKHADETEKLLG